MNNELEIYKAHIEHLHQHITHLNMRLLKATVKHKNKRANKLWWKMLLKNLKLKKVKNDFSDLIDDQGSIPLEANHG